MIMMSSRELRRVPLDYKHPTMGEQAERFGGSTWNQLPHPLFLRTYDEAVREWWDRREAWQRRAQERLGDVS